MWSSHLKRCGIARWIYIFRSYSFESCSCFSSVARSRSRSNDSIIIIHLFQVQNVNGNHVLPEKSVIYMHLDCWLCLCGWVCVCFSASSFANRSRSHSMRAEMAHKRIFYAFEVTRNNEMGEKTTRAATWLCLTFIAVVVAGCSALGALQSNASCKV